jgi:hypothetical protein
MEMLELRVHVNAPLIIIGMEIAAVLIKKLNYRNSSVFSTLPCENIFLRKLILKKSLTSEMNRKHFFRFINEIKNKTYRKFSTLDGHDTWIIMKKLQSLK